MPKVVDHAARRREISSVAACLIAKGGLEAATFREIARESGYSKGVVEHYFENKEELISGALAWANRQYIERAQQATAGLEGLAALRQRIEATLPLTQETRNEWKVRLVFWSMAAIHSELRKQQEERSNRTVDLFCEDLEAAAAMGEIERPAEIRDTARRLGNMIFGISTAALHQGSLYNRDYLLREADFLMAYLANAAAGEAQVST